MRFYVSIQFTLHKDLYLKYSQFLNDLQVQRERYIFPTIKNLTRQLPKHISFPLIFSCTSEMSMFALINVSQPKFTGIVLFSL